jgi:hypothetical protein
MLSRTLLRASFAPSFNGSAGLLLPGERRHAAEGRATPARTAAAILAERNTPFSLSKINAPQGLGHKALKLLRGLASAIAAIAAEATRFLKFPAEFPASQGIRRAASRCRVRVSAGTA